MPSDVTYPVVRGLRKRRQSLRNLSKGSVHGVVDEKTEMSGEGGCRHSGGTPHILEALQSKVNSTNVKEATGIRNEGNNKRIL